MNEWLISVDFFKDIFHSTANPYWTNVIVLNLRVVCPYNSAVPAAFVYFMGRLIRVLIAVGLITIGGRVATVVNESVTYIFETRHLKS